MMRAIAMALPVLASACAMPQTAEPDAGRKLSGGQVAKVAEAPDGTVLWAVDAGTRRVYFSSGGGAQWTEGCGKNCTRTVDVPGAVPFAK